LPAPMKGYRDQVSTFPLRGASHICQYASSTAVRREKRGPVFHPLECLWTRTETQGMNRLRSPTQNREILRYDSDTREIDGVERRDERDGFRKTPFRESPQGSL